jgi:hypothetical protein
MPGLRAMRITGFAALGHETVLRGGNDSLDLGGVPQDAARRL